MLVAFEGIRSCHSGYPVFRPAPVVALAFRCRSHGPSRHLVRTLPHAQPLRPMSAPLKSKRKQKLRAKLPKECAWCGATQDLTIDHILPRCFGGTNEQHNLWRR